MAKTTAFREYARTLRTGFSTRLCLWGIAALPALGIVFFSLKGCQRSFCASTDYQEADCQNKQECPCKIKDFRLDTKHCVRLIGCRSDSECPAGTVCLGEEKDALENEFSACVLDKSVEAPKTRCQLAQDRNPSALISGFRANEFLIERVEGSLAFRFVPPADAWFVACALFGCTPDIRPAGCDLGDQAVGRIVNYDRCALSGTPQVYSLRDSAGSEDTPFVFTASVAPKLDAGVACTTENQIQELEKETLTDISVGCWAYDDKSLIGATRMAPLETDQLEELSGALLDDCQSGFSDKKGGTCLLSQPEMDGPQIPEFGSCYQGQCRPRCVTARDCPVREPTSDCQEPVATCEHDNPNSGEAVLGSYIGVCLYACNRDDIVDAGVEPGDGGQP